MSYSDNDPEPAGPKSLSISQSAIYELLPAETTVGTLTSDDPNDGADNNSDFKIAGTLLRTAKMLDYQDGASRSVRIA